MKKQKGTKAKVAIVHPVLGFGGSEAPALWAIEALKQDYDVTLISTGEVDIERLNAFYGTSLAPGDLSIRRAPLPWGLRNSRKFAGLKGRFLQRYARRVAPEFDVLINSYGLIDFGRPAIVMIADLSFVEEWRFSLHPGVPGWKKWWYGSSPIRHLYLALCDWVSPVSPDVWKHSVALANSDWTGGLMREKYGIDSQTVYPPAEGTFPPIPFSDRDNGFVCLGRISPEKKVDAIIEILSQVRRKGHDIHLHILGGLDDSPYSGIVKNLADQNQDWVFIEGWALGKTKRELLAGHRYGIHGRVNEPFGIAVAEMVLAGCIVFVPQGGGQVEIVGHPALTYENAADAVGKIDAMLNDEAEQEKMRDHLRQGSDSFSVSTFMEKMRRVVAEFLEKQTQ
jgi:glycosyltransferase involved in cell wall biosynthesis